MGLDSYLLLGFQRKGFLKREGKDNLSMHAFLLCFLSFHFTLPFPFSYCICFQFSLFFDLGCYPLYVTATISIYTGLSLLDFSFLPLWLTNHFCLLIRPPPTLGMPSTFSPLHYTFHDNFQFVWFCRGPFLLPWMDKAMGLSLLTSLAYIK